MNCYKGTVLKKVLEVYYYSFSINNIHVVSVEIPTGLTLLNLLWHSPSILLLLPPPPPPTPPPIPCLSLSQTHTHSLSLSLYVHNKENKSKRGNEIPAVLMEFLRCQQTFVKANKVHAVLMKFLLSFKKKTQKNRTAVPMKLLQLVKSRRANDIVVGLMKFLRDRKFLTRE